MKYNDEWRDVTSIGARDGGLEMRDKIMARLEQDNIRLVVCYDGESEDVVLQERF